MPQRPPRKIQPGQVVDETGSLLLSGLKNLNIDKVPKSFQCVYIYKIRFTTVFYHRLVSCHWRDCSIWIVCTCPWMVQLEAQACQEARGNFELVGQKREQLEYKIIVSVPNKSCL